MTPIQKQFFALVQSGLWGTPVDTTLFNIQTDWAQLYQSAKVQALLGITFDGMQTLPQELEWHRITGIHCTDNAETLIYI